MKAALLLQHAHVEINGAGEGNRIYHVVSVACISVQCCAAYETTIVRQTARDCTQLQEFWHQLAPKSEIYHDAQIPRRRIVESREPAGLGTIIFPAARA